MTLSYHAIHSITLLASTNISNRRFVALDGTHAQSSALAVGITEEDAEPGRAFSAITDYSGLVEAAGAIPSGSFVKPAPDATGRAIIGSAADFCGRAMSEATRAGEMVVVRFLEASGGSGSSADSGRALARSYGMDLLCSEAAGGVFRDSTEGGAHMFSPPAGVATAGWNPHGTAGYFQSAGDGSGGTALGRLGYIPLAKFQPDLKTDSFVVQAGLKKNGVPATNRAIFGNVQAINDGYGFYGSVRTSGPQAGIIAPVFAYNGGSWSAATGYPASVLGSWFDGNDADYALLYDAPSGTVAVLKDYVIKGAWHNVIRPVGPSKASYPLGFGGICGVAGAASTDMLFRRIKARVWPNQGLPMNILSIVRTMSLYPTEQRYLADVYPPAAIYAAIAGSGQSNWKGSTSVPDVSQLIGAPIRDEVTSAGATSIRDPNANGQTPLTGSMHPMLAVLGGKRGIYRTMLNTAVGSTSLTQYWCGQLVTRAANTTYSLGAYAVAAGAIYKLTSSTNPTPTVATTSGGAVIWPASGSVVDSEATWTFVRAATADDVPGTVLPHTNPLFDPNGVFANIDAQVNPLPAVYTGNIALDISFCQTDKTVNATQAAFTAGLINATNWALANGRRINKVLIGLSNSGTAAGLDNWTSTIGKPSVAAALAYFAGNPRVFPGPDDFTELGTLAITANAPGLESDGLHLNQYAMALKATNTDLRYAAAGV